MSESWTDVSVVDDRGNVRAVGKPVPEMHSRVNLHVNSVWGVRLNIDHGCSFSRKTHKLVGGDLYLREATDEEVRKEQLLTAAVQRLGFHLPLKRLEAVVVLLDMEEAG